MTISRYARTPLFALAAVLSLTAGANAQDKKPEEPKQAAPAAAPAAQPPKPAAKPSTLRKYEDVITAEAKTQKGMFTVQKIDDKVYWEIPANLLGRDILVYIEFASSPQTLAYQGATTCVEMVRLTRRGNKIYVQKPNMEQRAVPGSGLEEAVALSTPTTYAMTWNIETENPTTKDAVVDVTGLFTSNNSELSFTGGLPIGVDPQRSWIERVAAFPENIETHSQMTLVMPRMGGGGSSSTINVHYSWNLLPEKPMVGRYRDDRVGFFSSAFDQYGDKKERVVTRDLIGRFRLEKKDPKADISEPVKPIVFYLAREVPNKWRPYLKRAVESWNVAFEQAGFRNAIRCEDAPSKEKDPNWDAEDVRYSVIRWVASPIQNAMGPSTQDPRSGETLSAHIIVWNEVVKLAQNWYFVQASPSDPSARKLPFSDDKLGQLIEYVAVHEVGHTLGLEHNFKASSNYTVQQLRSPEFTNKFGLSPSIMDYSRFNYVAQPGDGARLISKIGEYDKFAIEWGYKPFIGVNKPEDEVQQLDQIAARQVANPALRFGNYMNPADPTEETEDIGSDPVAATTLGIQNIRRVAKSVVAASTTYGENYEILADTYNDLIFQALLEHLHVTKLVGGVVASNLHAGRGEATFKVVPQAKQQEAVKFLVANMNPIPELNDPKILDRILAQNHTNVGNMFSTFVLRSLFSEGRLIRLQDQEAVKGNSTYTIKHLVDDVTSGLFKELDSASPSVNTYRRQLQRQYIETLDKKVNGSTASKTDAVPIIKDALATLAAKIDKTMPKVTDKMTAIHLKEQKSMIERILTAKSPASQGGGGSLFDLLAMFGLKDEQKGVASCWKVSKQQLLRMAQLDEKGN